MRKLLFIVAAVAALSFFAAAPPAVAEEYINYFPDPSYTSITEEYVPSGFVKADSAEQVNELCGNSELFMGDPFMQMSSTWYNWDQTGLRIEVISMTCDRWMKDGSRLVVAANAKNTEEALYSPDIVKFLDTWGDYFLEGGKAQFTSGLTTDMVEILDNDIGMVQISWADAVALCTIVGGEFRLDFAITFPATGENISIPACVVTHDILEGSMYLKYGFQVGQMFTTSIIDIAKDGSAWLEIGTFNEYQASVATN